MPDRIEEKLRTLALDVDRVGLADSGAVRRRGERRTRNQMLGAGLAAVAVLAGVVGLAGGLAGDRRAAEGPPAEEPSVSTTQEPLLSLSADPLLRPADIGAVGPQSGWQRSPDPVSESVRPNRCVTSPTTWGAAQRTEAAQYFTDLDGTIVEHVLQFPDVASSEDATLRGWAQFNSACSQGDPAQETAVDRPRESVPGAGGEAYRASRLTIPKADAGLAYYELAVARTGNVVVVLEWSSLGNPYGRDSTTWVWTADRLRLALDRAVSAAPATS